MQVACAPIFARGIFNYYHKCFADHRHPGPGERSAGPGPSGDAWRRSGGQTGYQQQVLS
jgi:hypothetical protein